MLSKLTNHEQEPSVTQLIGSPGATAFSIEETAAVQRSDINSEDVTLCSVVLSRNSNEIG